jgi:hypothetical protein
MTKQPNLPDVVVEDENLSTLTAAQFYASEKHQAVRKSLGISNIPRELPLWTWISNDEWRKFEDLRRSLPPARERAPEWEARAEDRKQRVQAELDRLYASKTASSTEIKNAEREWEFADDELDGGPFPDSEI